MRLLVDWSVRLRLLILGAALAVLVAGFVQLPSASLDAFPEYGPPYVEVQTEALGLSAEEVEQLVTVPLESKLLNGVAFLDSIESRSVQGLSSILLTFEPGADPIRARQMVAERLTQAHALPNVSHPPVMLQPLSSANRLMMVSVSSETHSLIDLSVLARWTIEPRLMGVPGVANVAIWGQRDRQLQVTVDPERLRDAGVTLDDVVETTGNALWVSPLTFLEASTPGTGGFIDTPNQRLNVQHLFPIDTADDLARVPVETSNPDARGLRLGDVAEVVEDHQPLIGDALVDDVPGLMLVIEKFPEASVVEVTAAVERALEAMSPGLAGVDFDTTVYRPATFLESAVANVGVVSLLGLVLLAAVLVGLLSDWRAAVVSVATIPISLVAAALVLHLAGATINTMVVLGFVAAIAIVVDDAVVGSHAVVRRRLTAGGAAASRAGLVVEAISSARGPIGYAAVAIALTAIPFLLLGGVTGVLLPSALAAYLLAAGMSAITALTVAPAVSVLLGEAASDRRRSRVMSRLEGAYARALEWTVQRSRVLVVAVAAAALVTVALFPLSTVPTLGSHDVPELEERDLVIHFDGAPGTSHIEMNRIVAAAGRELRGLDGVRGVGSHVGRAVTSDQVVGINAGQLWVSIAPEADYTGTRRAIESVIAGFPGIDAAIGTHAQDRVERLIATDADDLTVRVFGSDLGTMRASAASVRDAIAGIEGITAAAVEPQLDEPTIDVQVDVEAAAAHGLRPGDIRRAAATLLSGLQVGSLFEEQKVFDVVVWGSEEHRGSLTAVEQLLIETPDGELVELGDLAEVSVASSPIVIRRASVQGVIDVGATIGDRDTSAVLADVRAVLAGLDFPLESHAEVLEYTAERAANEAALLGAAVAVAIGLLLLLQAAFGSWRLAALVFLALPAALSGGMIVAAVLPGASPVATVAGLLAVLGLALRNAIVLIDGYRQVEQHGDEAPVPSLVQRARDGLTPVLTTAVGTGAALLPAALLGGRAGLEVIQPAVLVVLGGLLTSTLVNLFVVPSLFLRSGARPQAEAVAIPVEPLQTPAPSGARS